MKKLTVQICDKELKEFISDLEKRSMDSNQSKEDWLDCLQTMAEHLKDVAVNFESTIDQDPDE